MKRLNSAERSTGPPWSASRYLAPISKAVTSLAANSGMPGLKVPGHASSVRANSPLIARFPRSSLAYTSKAGLLSLHGMKCATGKSWQ